MSISHQREVQPDPGQFTAWRPEGIVDASNLDGVTMKPCQLATPLPRCPGGGRGLVRCGTWNPGLERGIRQLDVSNADPQLRSSSNFDVAAPQ